MRYDLASRLSSTPSEFEDEQSRSKSDAAKWEDTAAAREESLRERKAKMVLAARQRMLAKEKGKGKEKAVS